MTTEFLPRSAPWYATRFVGRESEWLAFGRQLEPGVVCGVTGPGGIGKTRFVSEVLRARSRRALFVDGSSAQSAEQLVSCVLRDLRASVPASEDPLEAAIELLKASAIETIVLDNLEQLGSLADGILGRFASAQQIVIYTSRIALDLPGERRADLAPLTDEDVQIDLFLESTPASLGPNDREAVARIVRALDGNPLAIELAAGRLTVLGIEELYERMKQAPGELLRDPSRLPDRGSALWRSISWSFELLPEISADVFEQLSSMEGPFTVAIAREVVSTEGDLRQILEQMLVWHLLRRTDGERMEWYSTVRAFAAQRLAQRPDHDQIFARHGEAFLAKGARQSSASREDVAAMWSDIADLDAIVERGLRQGASLAEIRRARRVEHLVHFVEAARRDWRSYDERLERLIAAGPPDQNVLSLLQKRYGHWSMLDPARAAGFARNILAIAEQFGNTVYQCAALFMLSYDALDRRAADEIRDLYQRLIAITRAHDLPVDEALALIGPINGPDLWYGHEQEVLARFGEAEALAERIPDFQRGLVYLESANTRAGLGRWLDARARLDKMFALGLTMTPIHRELVIWAALLIEVGSDGGRDLQRVEELHASLSPLTPADRRLRCDLLVAIARRLHAGNPVHIELPAPKTRDEEQMAMAIAVVRALDSDDVLIPDVPVRDPAARAVRDAAQLAIDVLSGRLPSEALQALDALAPPSAWLQVVRQLARYAASVRDERDRTWEIARDGRWFRPPGGERIELTPLHARLLAALVEGRSAGIQGLDADVLFSAGWPGEHAKREAAVNRIRVAVTAMRKQGLTILGWSRSSGWLLEAPVSVR